jgi:hypothetical protein
MVLEFNPVSRQVSDPDAPTHDTALPEPVAIGPAFTAMDEI